MATCEHKFGSDGVCQKCQHWDPTQHTDPVHLATGLRVCNDLKSWCGAKIVVVGNRVRNATEAEDRCTCEPCKTELQRVKERYARPR